VAGDQGAPVGAAGVDPGDVAVGGEAELDIAAAEHDPPAVRRPAGLEVGEPGVAGHRVLAGAVGRHHPQLEVAADVADVGDPRPVGRPGRGAGGLVGRDMGELAPAAAVGVDGEHLGGRRRFLGEDGADRVGDPAVPAREGRLRRATVAEQTTEQRAEQEQPRQSLVRCDQSPHGDTPHSWDPLPGISLGRP
jgi:hypothetical protein